MQVKPDTDVAEGLEEQIGDDGEEREKGQEMPDRLLLDEGVMRAAVADHDDGDGGQADVDNQILVVARFSSNLFETFRF